MLSLLATFELTSADDLFWFFLQNSEKNKRSADLHMVCLSRIAVPVLRHAIQRNGGRNSHRAGLISNP